METHGPITELVRKYGRLTRPSEVDILRFKENKKYCLLIAIISDRAGEETMIGIQDEQIFNEIIENWKAAPAQELSLWLIRNVSRTALSVDFVRLFGRLIEVEKNALTYKGLDWQRGAVWAVILNDRERHRQGELFPPSSPAEIMVLSPDDQEGYQLFRRGWKRGDFAHFDVYKLPKRAAEQFRSIFPKWIQRELMNRLQEKETIRIPAELEEAG